MTIAGSKVFVLPSPPHSHTESKVLANLWGKGSYPSNTNNNWVAYVDLNQGFQGREEAAAKAGEELNGQ
jgi:hypothetical protein